MIPISCTEGKDSTGSAARIGLIPQTLLPVTMAIGNAAVEGAHITLYSEDARTRILALRDGMD